jgi:hypothetical protein
VSLAPRASRGGRGQQEPRVGHRRLGQQQRHVAWRQRALDGIQVVERHDPEIGGDLGRQAGVLRSDPAVFGDAQRWLEVTVVLAVEDEDPLTAGPDPGDPHDLGIRLRRVSVNCHLAIPYRAASASATTSASCEGRRN